MIDSDRLYLKALKSLLANNKISVGDSVLVVCGGYMDRNVLSHLKFTNVIVSNLDDRYDQSLEPYQWCHQDAEMLSYDAECIDWVIVHAGLHHCYSPHKALIEMMRVCKKGILVIEARNSFLSRLAKSMGMIATYEVEAVVGNDMKAGGVANSQIPNYVYRWTENEVQGIVSSYWPQYENNKIQFFYNLRIPIARLKKRKSNLLYGLVSILSFAIKGLNYLFPKQSNEFAFFVEKGTQLQPWLIENGDTIDLDPGYVSRRFS